MLITWLFLFVSVSLQSQNQWNINSHLLKSSVIPHSENIKHLIENPSNGFFLSIDQQSTSESWKKKHNLPEYGFSLHGQFNKNKFLGDVFGIFAHTTFSFLNNNLHLKIGQGISYATNPYNAFSNYRNIAYGTHFMPATFFMLNYQKNNFIGNWGLQAGLLFTHHSNGSTKAPNTGTNTISFSTGINYTFESKYNIPEKQFVRENKKYSLQTNFRTGVNESHIIGMGQKPFYHLAIMGNKNFNIHGNWQFGTEFFWSYTIKELTQFMAISFPETKTKQTDDWRRIGIFLGYEHYLNKLSIEAQTGYYIYTQYRRGATTYQRIGMKYYFSNRLQGLLSLKTHMGNAEALEFGIGYKIF